MVVSYEQKPAWIIAVVRQSTGPKDMERVNITIGLLTFDRANYDAVNDVLYLHLGDPQAGGGRGDARGPRPELCTWDEPSDRSEVGVRQTLERDGRLSITVPETVETTAKDLAPAYGCRVAAQARKQGRQARRVRGAPEAVSAIVRGKRRRVPGL